MESKLNREIIEAVGILVADNVPATSAQIKTLIPDKSVTQIASALVKLFQLDRLLRVRLAVTGPGQPMYRYEVNKSPNPLAKRKTTPKPPVPTPPVPTKELSWDESLQAAMMEKIAVLEAWKANAEARYPALRIDPKVLEARKIVSKVFRDNGDHAHANEVENGSKDKAPIMLATLAALEA